MIIDGKTIDSVGVKLRGTTSAHDEQKPMEVDLNEFVKGQEYDGLKKFLLRNNYEDPTLQREPLAFEIYRRAGLPSPRTAYAEVYVDGVFRGIYTLTEEIDKSLDGLISDLTLLKSQLQKNVRKTSKQKLSTN